MTDDHRTSGVLWACVEEGFHVGSRDGNFLGYIDRRPGGAHEAYDARSVLIGSFASLEEATRAVSDAALSAGELTPAPDSAQDGAL